MYDLPYEKGPEEPGLPDEFHDLQPQLLSATFQVPDYDADRIFTASDMNVYYDVHNQLWYKRPDWFGVVDEPKVGNGKELPPRKWDVYERILRVPYYVVFDRYTDALRFFRKVGSHYEAMELPENKAWIPELKIGICTWQGKFQGIERLWLRWFDASGRIIETEGERLEKKREALRKERDHSQKLRELGIDPDEV